MIRAANCFLSNAAAPAASVRRRSAPASQARPRHAGSVGCDDRSLVSPIFCSASLSVRLRFVLGFAFVVGRGGPSVIGCQGQMRLRAAEWNVE